MRARAKRRGHSEELSDVQALDMAPYAEAEHASDDLEGELVQFTVPANEEHGLIEVCTVDGQEADPDTVQVI